MKKSFSFVFIVLFLALLSATGVNAMQVAYPVQFVHDKEVVDGQIVIHQNLVDQGALRSGSQGNSFPVPAGRAGAVLRTTIQVVAQQLAVKKDGQVDGELLFSLNGDRFMSATQEGTGIWTIQQDCQYLQPGFQAISFQLRFKAGRERTKLYLVFIPITAAAKNAGQNKAFSLVNPVVAGAETGAVDLVDWQKQVVAQSTDGIVDFNGPKSLQQQQVTTAPVQSQIVQQAEMLLVEDFPTLPAATVVPETRPDFKVYLISADRVAVEVGQPLAHDLIIEADFGPNQSPAKVAKVIKAGQGAMRQKFQRTNGLQITVSYNGTCWRYDRNASGQGGGSR